MFWPVRTCIILERHSMAFWGMVLLDTDNGIDGRSSSKVLVLVHVRLEKELEWLVLILLLYYGSCTKMQIPFPDHGFTALPHHCPFALPVTTYLHSVTDQPQGSPQTGLQLAACQV